MQERVFLQLLKRAHTHTHTHSHITRRAFCSSHAPCRTDLLDKTRSNNTGCSLFSRGNAVRNAAIVISPWFQIRCAPDFYLKQMSYNKRGNFFFHIYFTGRRIWILYIQQDISPCFILFSFVFRPVAADSRFHLKFRSRAVCNKVLTNCEESSCERSPNLLRCDDINLGMSTQQGFLPR